MTEQEYIDLSNLIHLKSCLDSLRKTDFSDSTNKALRFSVAAKVSTMIFNVSDKVKIND